MTSLSTMLHRHKPFDNCNTVNTYEGNNRILGYTIVIDGVEYSSVKYFPRKFDNSLCEMYIKSAAQELKEKINALQHYT